MGDKPPQPAKTGNYNRDIYSVYGSYKWNMTEQDQLIFNARQTFVRNADGITTEIKTGKTGHTVQKDQSKFTPEIQYIRKLDDHSSFYAGRQRRFRCLYSYCPHCCIPNRR